MKLNRQLERCLRNSKCIDTESLCVVSGEKVCYTHQRLNRITNTSCYRCQDSVVAPRVFHSQLQGLNPALYLFPFFTQLPTCSNSAFFETHHSHHPPHLPTTNPLLHAELYVQFRLGLGCCDSCCAVVCFQVWQIRVDVHMLNHDGNLMDATSIAAIAALSHFKRPDVGIQGDEVTVVSVWAFSRSSCLVGMGMLTLKLKGGRCSVKAQWHDNNVAMEFVVVSPVFPVHSVQYMVTL